MQTSQTITEFLGYRVEHPGSLLSDLEVSQDEFVVGFKRESLLLNRWYVWFQGRPKNLRQCRRDFQAYAPKNCFCQILMTSPRFETEVRFANFFGFVASHVIDNRLHMERK